MTEAPLFDAYLMVDWSAAAEPRQGKDSIWLYHLRRGGPATRPENLHTRHEARERLLALLEENLRAGLRTLAGFDFPLGYPAGFAERLGLGDPPWRAVWRYLAERITDDAENHNNRFDVAAELNRRLGKNQGPFWGCPHGQSRPFLAPKHHRGNDVGLAERRITEKKLKTTQPVWKLYGAGSVGSQALTGIPVVEALYAQFSAKGALVWPFNTGLAAPTHAPLVFAEIYPSLFEVLRRDNEVLDAAQVRTLAEYFAMEDTRGALAGLFRGDPALSAAERAQVEREEGWILGAPAGEARHAASPSTRMTYLRDPQAIYRESFARIRREVDLARLPPALHAVALRLVHAAGDPTWATQLLWSPEAAERGAAALRAGAPVLVDARMVAAGINASLLPKKNRVLCFIDDKRVPALVKRLDTTRSAAAVELWRPHLGGAVVAIGNAPTALFHLLELIVAGAAKPALVLGFPVGFVGATEAKAALAENAFALSFITLPGRRGGSALAAASVNALARPEAEA